MKIVASSRNHNPASELHELGLTDNLCERYMHTEDEAKIFQPIPLKIDAI